jgi:hypothetical protein
MISRSVSRIISLREGTLRRGGRRMCCSRRDRDIWIMSCWRGRLSRGRRSRRCESRGCRHFLFPPPFCDLWIQKKVRIVG